MILGITGNYGSGKTAVAAMLSELGAAVIDVDKIGHEVLESQSGKIISEFGDVILVKGKIDRQRLGNIVFNDKDKLRKLNKMTHHLIFWAVKKLITNKPTVIDAALLFEIGLDKLCDRTAAVVCRQARVSTARKAMISAHQIPEQDLIKKADFVIDNSGTLEDTRRQVKSLWQKII